MKKNRLNKLIFTGTAFAGGLILFNTMKKRNEKRFWVYEDNDMRNSIEVDQEESVNAKYDDAEKGLTQLDSAYRSEWQAMDYPRTQRKLEEADTE